MKTLKNNATIKVTVIATGFNGGGVTRISEVVNSSTLFSPPGAKTADRKQEISMFQEKLDAKSGVRRESSPEKVPEKPLSKKKTSDTWDIPAFLRKKRK